jgi:hypothetical protein
MWLRWMFIWTLAYSLVLTVANSFAALNWIMLVFTEQIYRKFYIDFAFAYTSYCKGYNTNCNQWVKVVQLQESCVMWKFWNNLDAVMWSIAPLLCLKTVFLMYRPLSWGLNVMLFLVQRLSSVLVVTVCEHFGSVALNSTPKTEIVLRSWCHLTYCIIWKWWCGQLLLNLVSYCDVKPRSSLETSILSWSQSWRSLSWSLDYCLGTNHYSQGTNNCHANTVVHYCSL